MIKLTVKDKGVFYFSREKVEAIAKDKKKFDLKKYNDKSFLPGNFFMDNFAPEWLDLYASTEPMDFNLELSCSIKK